MNLSKNAHLTLRELETMPREWHPCVLTPNQCFFPQGKLSSNSPLGKEPCNSIPHPSCPLSVHPVSYSDGKVLATGISQVCFIMNYSFILHFRRVRGRLVFFIFSLSSVRCKQDSKREWRGYLYNRYYLSAWRADHLKHRNHGLP